jgi:hypothetical protein
MNSHGAAGEEGVGRGGQGEGGGEAKRGPFLTRGERFRV